MLPTTQTTRRPGNPDFRISEADAAGSRPPEGAVSSGGDSWCPRDDEVLPVRTRTTSQHGPVCPPPSGTSPTHVARDRAAYLRLLQFPLGLARGWCQPPSQPGTVSPRWALDFDERRANALKEDGWTPFPNQKTGLVRKKSDGIPPSPVTEQTWDGIRDDRKLISGAEAVLRFGDANDGHDADADADADVSRSENKNPDVGIAHEPIVRRKGKAVSPEGPSGDLDRFPPQEANRRRAGQGGGGGLEGPIIQFAAQRSAPSRVVSTSFVLRMEERVVPKRMSQDEGVSSSSSSSSAAAAAAAKADVLRARLAEERKKAFDVLELSGKIVKSAIAVYTDALRPGAAGERASSPLDSLVSGDRSHGPTAVPSAAAVASGPYSPQSPSPRFYQPPVQHSYRYYPRNTRDGWASEGYWGTCPPPSAPSYHPFAYASEPSSEGTYGTYGAHYDRLPSGRSPPSSVGAAAAAYPTNFVPGVTMTGDRGPRAEAAPHHSPFPPPAAVTRNPHHYHRNVAPHAQFGYYGNGNGLRPPPPPAAFHYHHHHHHHYPSSYHPYPAVNVGGSFGGHGGHFYGGSGLGFRNRSPDNRSPPRAEAAPVPTPSTTNLDLILEVTGCLRDGLKEEYCPKDLLSRIKRLCPPQPDERIHLEVLRIQLRDMNDGKDYEALLKSMPSRWDGKTDKLHDCMRLCLEKLDEKLRSGSIHPDSASVMPGDADRQHPVTGTDMSERTVTGQSESDGSRGNRGNRGSRGRSESGGSRGRCGGARRGGTSRRRSKASRRRNRRRRLRNARGRNRGGKQGGKQGGSQKRSRGRRK